MHLDDEQLQRLLHGELDPRTARSLTEHVAACAECRTRLTEAERDQAEVYGLLRLVDHPPPLANAESIAATARGHGRGWGRWAAGVLLAVAVAGAAYAAPGSPLPEWSRAAWDWVQDINDPEAPPAPPVPAMAGLAVPPGNALTILFDSPQPRARARISLGEWAEVRVRAPSGAATFGSEADRLHIANHDSTATFEIEIPREARRVEIRVAGETIFLKEGPRVTVPATGGGHEVYLLPLAPLTSQ